MECLNNEDESPQEETLSGEGKTSAPHVAASSDANASKEKGSKLECSSCDADHASSERESGKCVLIAGKFVVILWELVATYQYQYQFIWEQL